MWPGIAWTQERSSQGEGGLQSEIDAGVFQKMDTIDDQAWEALLKLGAHPQLKNELEEKKSTSTKNDELKDLCGIDCCTTTL